MNIDWFALMPVKTSMLRYMASNGSVHDCLAGCWSQVLEADEGAVVIANGPTEWLAFIKKQQEISGAWSVRNCYTAFDAYLMGRMGIGW